MSLTHSPQIVTNGLIYMLDPANRKVWNGTSTSMTSLINNGVNTISNGPYGYDTSTYLVPVMTINNALLSTATSTCTIALSTPDLNTLALNQNITVMFAAKKNYYGYGGNSNGNTEFMQGVSNGYGNGWRISEIPQTQYNPASTPIVQPIFPLLANIRILIVCSYRIDNNGIECTVFKETCHYKCPDPPTTNN